VATKITETPATSLVAKMIEAGTEAGVIQKAGKNEAQGYKFTSEADVVLKVGPALFKRGVLVYPLHTIHSIVEYATKGGAQAFLTTIQSIWTFTDGEYHIEVGTVGQGTDTGGDKGVYKAMTGSKKYALLQALMIATGDDPEISRPDEKKESEAVDPNKPTTSQMKKMFAAANDAGVKLSAIVEQETGKLSSKQLVKADVDTILTAIKIIKATGGGSMDSPPFHLPVDEAEPEVPSGGPD
jgi:hypothetical protein